MKRLLLLCIYLFSFHNIGKQNHIHPIHILTHTFRLTKIKLEFWNQNMKKKYVVRLSENYSLLKAYCVMIFYYSSFYRDWPSLWKAPLCNDLYSSFFIDFFLPWLPLPFISLKGKQAPVLSLVKTRALSLPQMTRLLKINEKRPTFKWNPTWNKNKAPYLYQKRYVTKYPMSSISINMLRCSLTPLCNIPKPSWFSIRVLNTVCN